MKLIVISSSKTLANETQILTSFFEQGLQTLHLNKPKYSTPKLAKLIRSIPEKYHNRIIIHSHHNLLLKFDLKGVHLTKKHKKKKIRTWFIHKILRSRKPDFETTT